MAIREHYERLKSWLKQRYMYVIVFILLLGSGAFYAMNTGIDQPAVPLKPVEEQIQPNSLDLRHLETGKREVRIEDDKVKLQKKNASIKLKSKPKDAAIKLKEDGNLWETGFKQKIKSKKNLHKIDTDVEVYNERGFELITDGRNRGRYSLVGTPYVYIPFFQCIAYAANGTAVGQKVFENEVTVKGNVLTLSVKGELYAENADTIECYDPLIDEETPIMGYITADGANGTEDANFKAYMFNNSLRNFSRVSIAVGWTNLTDWEGAVDVFVFGSFSGATDNVKQLNQTKKGIWVLHPNYVPLGFCNTSDNWAGTSVTVVQDTNPVYNTTNSFSNGSVTLINSFKDIYGCSAAVNIPTTAFGVANSGTTEYGFACIRNNTVIEHHYTTASRWCFWGLNDRVFSEWTTLSRELTVKSLNWILEPQEAEAPPEPEAVPSTIAVEWISPSTHFNHTVNTFMDYVFNITCQGDTQCNVNYTLDPLITDGHVLSLGFDNNLTDRTPDPLTIGTSGSPSYVTAKVGNAARAYSSGNKDLITHADKFNLGNNLTVSFWVNSSGAVTGRQTIINGRNPDSTNRWLIEIGACGGSGGGRVCTVQSGSYNFRSEEGLITQNNWHHVIVVKEGTTTDAFRVFIDGVLSAQEFNSSRTFADSTVPKELGEGESTGNPLVGRLDELNVWNRSLSDDEILAIYANESTNISFPWVSEAAPGAGKGIIQQCPATPFCTTDPNPGNITIPANGTAQITIAVNATGTINQTYLTFVNITLYDNASMKNNTPVLNVTIREAPVGPVFALVDKFTSFSNFWTNKDVPLNITCTEATTYSWKVNGTEVGTSATYLFTGYSPGNYSVNGECGDGVDTESFQFNMVVLEPDTFTVVHVPDTHYFTTIPSYLENISQWILEEREYLNISFVGYSGDLLDSTAFNITKLLSFNTTMAQTYGIPFAYTAGNHDYDSDLVATRKLGNWTRYLTHFKDQSHFSATYDSRYVATAHNFSYGGIDMVSIMFEMCPSQAVLDWVNDTLESHENRSAFLYTHLFMNADDTRLMTIGQNDCTEYFSTNYTTPEDMWDDVLQYHDNVVMVSSGHQTSDGVGYRNDSTVNGRPVHQILYNPQNIDAYPGKGRFRFYVLDDSENKATTYTYNPADGDVSTSEDNTRVMGINLTTPTTAPVVPICAASEDCTIDCSVYDNISTSFNNPNNDLSFVENGVIRIDANQFYRNIYIENGCTVALKNGIVMT